VKRNFDKTSSFESNSIFLYKSYPEIGKCWEDLCHEVSKFKVYDCNVDEIEGIKFQIFEMNSYVMVTFK